MKFDLIFHVHKQKYFYFKQKCSPFNELQVETNYLLLLSVTIKQIHTND